MRFAATHKAVSYLMVSAAFVMLVLAGEVPGVLSILTVAGIATSYFYDPQNHPFMARRSYAATLYAVLILAAILLFPDPTQGETLWDSGTRFLCVLLCVKLWRRRNNSDYLQAYLISFLMLLIASLVGASIVYAVCLVLYSVFATWTLSLFHLRREMEENYLLKHLPGRHGQAAESERVEVERILNSRRVVGTPFLVATGSLALILFVVGGLLFLLLPRVGVGLELPLRRRGLLLTGFAEQIQLGGHGLLRENPRVVMRVELQGGTPPAALLANGLRFRGTAFDAYQDGKWSHQASAPPAPIASGHSAAATVLPGATAAPAIAGSLHGERPVPYRQGHHFLDNTASPVSLTAPGVVRAEIYLEPLETAALFVPVAGTSSSRPLAITLPSAWYYAAQWPLSIGPDDDLISRSRPGSLHYTVYLSSADAGPDVNAGHSAPVAVAAPSAAYLQLPQVLAPRLRELAQQITAPYSRPIDKARALERYLQTQFSYSTQLAALTDGERSRQGDPVAAFLFERKRGHCEYFASALALLLRAIDIPSRSVNGYLGGEWNEYGHYLVVRQQHAHSWVEAWLPHAVTPSDSDDGMARTGSWVTLDPTPLSALMLPRHGFLQRARRFSDSMEMSWNKYVLEYDPRAQQRLGERLRSLFRMAPGLRPPSGRTIRSALVALSVLITIALAAIVTRRLGQRFGHGLDAQSRQQLQQQNATRSQIRRALAELRRRGFVQSPGETLRKLAERVEESGDECAPHFTQIVGHYYAHRFGHQQIDIDEITRLSDAMIDSPRRPGPLNPT